ncbi:MAG TPA: aminotransferase class V-fold PLP-dependent enzyme [Opitutaceae bacterium]
MPYFDHNATTPLAAAAREAWLRASEEAWQNPSSPYRAAARVRLRLDAVREKLALLLETEAARIVFTAGATEAANAILAHLARTLPAGACIAVNPTEHPCVLAAAQAHFGADRIVWLPVTRDGVVTADAVKTTLKTCHTLHDEMTGQPAAAAPESCHLLGDKRSEAGPRRIGAVVVMAANNETGVLQPWAEIARACRAAGVASVCDASQWLGKLTASGLAAADWVFGAAHKFGGPKGTGFLLLAPQADAFRGQQGGEQEHGHRAGTEDFPGIAAMVAALAEAEQKKVFLETERLRLREGFEREVRALAPGVQIVGAGAERLWNTVSLVMPHGENQRWVARLDKRGVEVSTGSACATGKEGPSHVLAALGYTPDEARRVLRVSAGWETTPQDWAALLAALEAVKEEVRPAEAVIKT